MPHEVADDLVVAGLQQHPSSSRGGVANQDPRQGRIGQVKALDEQGLVLAQAKGMIEQDRGEGIPARIGRWWLSGKDRAAVGCWHQAQGDVAASCGTGKQVTLPGHTQPSVESGSGAVTLL